MREILFILYISLQLALLDVTIFIQSSIIVVSAIFLWDERENCSS